MLNKIILKIYIVLSSAFIVTIIILAVQNDKEDNDQLTGLDFYKGQLSWFNIDYKQSSSGLRLKYKFVALNISGLHQTMGIYRPEQQYDDILDHIKIGDTVSIYYRRHCNNCDTLISGIHFNSDINKLDINNKNYICKYPF